MLQQRSILPRILNDLYENQLSVCRIEVQRQSSASSLLIRLSSLVAAALVAIALSPGEVQADKVKPRERVFERAAIIEMHGPITSELKSYFDRRLQAAKDARSDLIIVELDSPGGGLDQSLEIAEALREIDWATTVAYVPQRALSGAAIISLGCDQLIMAADARVGDAGVIFMDESFMFRYAPEKIMSDLVRRARDLADANGYPADLAEAMIDRHAVVYERSDEAMLVGEGDRFRIEHFGANQAEESVAPKTLDDGNWTMIEETAPTRFLEVNGQRAFELGLASNLTDDRTSLLSSLKVNDSPVVYQHTTTDTFVYWLNLPWITGLIVVIGLVALYFELSAPGISIGGLTAGLCFVLFFWSRFMGGTAAWLEVLLFVAGIVFIAVEIFVIPGTGISGIAGLVLVVGSLAMASQSFVIPQNSVEAASLGKSVGVLFGSFALFGIVATILSRYAGVIPVVRGFVLTPERQESGVGADGNGTAKSGKLTSVKRGDLTLKLGDCGIAESVLRPSGKVRIGNTTIDVLADGSYIEEGAAVEIKEIRGNRIVVRALPA